MAYTVKYNVQRELAPVGEHFAEIESWYFREYTGEVTFQNITITWVTDLNEIAWDTIFQRIDPSGEYLIYDEKKMNDYSQAVKIPEGTHFDSIEAWLDYLIGRKATIVISEKNERTYVTEIKPVEDVVVDEPPF